MVEEQFITSVAENRVNMPAMLPDFDTPEKQKLPAVLGTKEMAVFLLLIIMFISNVNGVQFGGPATFLYWGLGILTFLIPSAYVTRWLALRIPGQGAPYIWASRILGPGWNFLIAFCAWWPGVFAVVSAVDICVVFIQYLFPTWFSTPGEQGITMAVVLVVATAITCLPLRHLKNILLVLGALYLSIFVLIGAAGVWWLMGRGGHAAAVSFSTPANWQLNGGNFGVFGLVILALLGIDIPLFMGGEIRGGKAGARRATSYVWWGTAGTIIAYGLGTFGVMVIVPPAQSGALTANVQAIQMAFGPAVGNIASIVLALSHVTLSVAYILMYSRLLVVVAQDGRLPSSLLKLNRHGVPILSIVVQGGITLCATLLSFVVIPGLLGSIINPADLANEIYNVLLASASALWALSTAFLCLFVIWLVYRRMRKTKIAHIRHFFVMAISLVGTISAGIGIGATFTSSWLPTLLPNNRWVVLVVGSVVLSIAIGWIGSELPRVHALLGEQKRLNDRQLVLSEQLQEAYDQQQLLLSELDRLYREQAQAAVTDAVTGLPNHRAVMSKLDEVLSHCQRAQSSCAVLFVDLDHFKRVNDSYGHRAGDAILREVAERLRNGIRLEDFVGRYGGEEFAIILTNTDVLAASQVADRLLIALNSQPCCRETGDTRSLVTIAISGSIGVSVYQLHGTTREELIESADRAMYQAKTNGRNRVCIADVEITELPDPVGTRLIASAPLTPGVVDVIEQDMKELVGLQALTAAAAARDGDTCIHAHRLVELAVATARKLRQNDQELHMLRLGAILHDIGKIGIPDAILHKPGPLTGEEWKIMRSHPDIGRHILEEIGGVFNQLAEVVVAHHERWDGAGYPMKLAGEAIPLHARILTVVDSFDAMTSRRVYREPMSIEAARAELQRCSGTQFDPRVVAAFLSVLDDQQQTLPPSEQETEAPNGAVAANL
ncbi:MAG TPA: amino acid permease [Ktedonobacteraceae bacterium]|nr:amino acid permease [Ktedonobacteraceae bacterium]